MPYLVFWGFFRVVFFVFIFMVVVFMGGVVFVAGGGAVGGILVEVYGLRYGGIFLNRGLFRSS